MFILILFTIQFVLHIYIQHFRFHLSAFGRIEREVMFLSDWRFHVFANTSNNLNDAINTSVFLFLEQQETASFDIDKRNKFKLFAMWLLGESKKSEAYSRAYKKN